MTQSLDSGYRSLTNWKFFDIYIYGLSFLIQIAKIQKTPSYLRVSPTYHKEVYIEMTLTC